MQAAVLVMTALLWSGTQSVVSGEMDATLRKVWSTKVKDAIANEIWNEEEVNKLDLMSTSLVSKVFLQTKWPAYDWMTISIHKDGYYKTTVMHDSDYIRYSKALWLGKKSATFNFWKTKTTVAADVVASRKSEWNPLRNEVITKLENGWAKGREANTKEVFEEYKGRGLIALWTCDYYTDVVKPPTLWWERQPAGDNMYVKISKKKKCSKRTETSFWKKKTKEAYCSIFQIWGAR